MAAPGGSTRGLSAIELAAVVDELLPAIAGAAVLDVATIAGTDDLLLVLQRRDDAGEPGAKVFVHVAPGGPRARVTTTARRFPRDAFGAGPGRQVLQQELAAAVVRDLTQAPGERRCTFAFATTRGERRLHVELFGARGLWALADPEGRVRALSRDVETAVRTLRLGAPYSPPPPAPAPPDEPSRFAPPVLAAVDEHFTAGDLRQDREREHDTLQRAAARAMQKARAKVAGLQQQLAAAGRADEIREQADLMLAYAHSVPRGALRMSVPDPQREGAERTFELDPARPVVVQAQALYERARRLEEGAAMTARRLAEAEALAAALTPIAATLDAPADDATLATLRARLQELGAVQHSPRTPTRTRPPTEVVRGTDFRRFVSAEGYTILVGRNNEQNDQLTMRTANGNDLWLHVGGGRPGSHVVVRLPKGKTASLETLLDAGALAVHFSKARGEPRLDVIYTFRKHVRKPKGLPAGAVVPSQTKTLTVLHDEARLRRLLDSGGGEE